MRYMYNMFPTLLGLGSQFCAHSQPFLGGRGGGNSFKRTVTFWQQLKHIKLSTTLIPMCSNSTCIWCNKGVIELWRHKRSCHCVALNTFKIFIVLAQAFKENQESKPCYLIENKFGL